MIDRRNGRTSSYTISKTKTIKKNKGFREGVEREEESMKKEIGEIIESSQKNRKKK